VFEGFYKKGQKGRAVLNQESCMLEEVYGGDDA